MDICSEFALQHSPRFIFFEDRCGTSSSLLRQLSKEVFSGVVARGMELSVRALLGKTGSLRNDLDRSPSAGERRAPRRTTFLDSESENSAARRGKVR